MIKITKKMKTQIPKILISLALIVLLITIIVLINKKVINLNILEKFVDTANGTTGTNGATEPTGTNGATGTNGTTGSDGATGTNTEQTGSNTEQTGSNPTGTDGTTGSDGATGTNTEQTGSNTEQTGSNPTGTNPTGTNPTGTNPTGTNTAANTTITTSMNNNVNVDNTPLKFEGPPNSNFYLSKQYGYVSDGNENIPPNTIVNQVDFTGTSNVFNPIFHVNREEYFDDSKYAPY